MGVTNSRSRVRASITVGLAGLVVGLSMRCNPGQVTPLVEPGCPDDRIAIEMPDGRVVTNIPLAASIDETHEFHDCQALITGPKRYGPRVAIFASEQLAFFQPSNEAQPVAVIYNYDKKESYDSLGIEPGFNCLLLWKEDTGPKARISPNEYDENVCSEVSEDLGAASGKDLEVRYAPVQPGGPTVVPPVARWDWDRNKQLQFIGIKCGNEWCEIGPKGFGQSPDHKWDEFQNLPGKENLPSQAELPPGRLRKGWYDEQRLAIKDGQDLVPADEPAIAIPHPALNRHNNPVWYENHWRPAAFVILPTDLQGYDAKNKNWKKGVNRVSLCWESKTDGCIPDAEKPVCKDDWKSDDGRAWWAKTKSSGNNEEYGCVKRCERDQPVPGTVRWRWQEDDEKLWIRCATGCCTIN